MSELLAINSGVGPFFIGYVLTAPLSLISIREVIARKLGVLAFIGVQLVCKAFMVCIVLYGIKIINVAENYMRPSVNVVDNPEAFVYIGYVWLSTMAVQILVEIVHTIYTFKLSRVPVSV